MPSPKSIERMLGSISSHPSSGLTHKKKEYTEHKTSVLSPEGISIHLGLQADLLLKEKGN